VKDERKLGEALLAGEKFYLDYHHQVTPPDEWTTVMQDENKLRHSVTFCFMG